MSDQLNVIVEKKQEGVFLIKPQGRIDSDTYTELEKELEPILAQGPKGIILNMSGVDYISSAGLSVVFKTKKTIDANNGTFALTNLQPQVRKVFDVVKALPSHDIFASVEEADKYFDAIQKKELEGDEA
ncbi:MAG: STAS domain-containing protein [Candidatus Omnitrophica bacterium]|nr:STAS domain-containing protein [Candidatus Omnitrophota bacterium]